MGNSGLKTINEQFILSQLLDFLALAEASQLRSGARFFKSFIGSPKNESFKVVTKLFFHQESIDAENNIKNAVWFFEKIRKLDSPFLIPSLYSRVPSDSCPGLTGHCFQRQGFHLTLMDRLQGTRQSFGTKLWICLQLLMAFCDLHERAHLFHGDFKGSNVFVTSKLNILIADFAHFKPHFIPKDNLDELNFFYPEYIESCTLAPEKLLQSKSSFLFGSSMSLYSSVMLRQQQENSRVLNLRMEASNQLIQEISHSELLSLQKMDIFSLGCVFGSILMDGQCPLFTYEEHTKHFQKNQKETPKQLAKFLGQKPKIAKKAEKLLGLLEKMVQKDPSERLSAKECLQSFIQSYFSPVSGPAACAVALAFASQVLSFPDHLIAFTRHIFPFISQDLLENQNEAPPEFKKALPLSMQCEFFQKAFDQIQSQVESNYGVKKKGGKSWGTRQTGDFLKSGQRGLMFGENLRAKELKETDTKRKSTGKSNHQIVSISWFAQILTQVVFSQIRNVSYESSALVGIELIRTAALLHVSDHKRFVQVLPMLQAIRQWAQSQKLQNASAFALEGKIEILASIKRKFKFEREKKELLKQVKETLEEFSTEDGNMSELDAVVFTKRVWKLLRVQAIFDPNLPFKTDPFSIEHFLTAFETLMQSEPFLISIFINEGLHEVIRWLDHEIVSQKVFSPLLLYGNLPVSTKLYIVQLISWKPDPDFFTKCIRPVFLQAEDSLLDLRILFQTIKTLEKLPLLASLIAEWSNKTKMDSLKAHFFHLMRFAEKHKSPQSLPRKGVEPIKEEEPEKQQKVFSRRLETTLQLIQETPVINSLLSFPPNLNELSEQIIITHIQSGLKICQEMLVFEGSKMSQVTSSNWIASFVLLSELLVQFMLHKDQAEEQSIVNLYEESLIKSIKVKEEKQGKRGREFKATRAKVFQLQKVSGVLTIASCQGVLLSNGGTSEVSLYPFKSLARSLVPKPQLVYQNSITKKTIDSGEVTAMAQVPCLDALVCGTSQGLINLFHLSGTSNMPLIQIENKNDSVRSLGKYGNGPFLLYSTLQGKCAVRDLRMPQQKTAQIQFAVPRTLGPVTSVLGSFDDR